MRALLVAFTLLIAGCCASVVDLDHQLHTVKLNHTVEVTITLTGYRENEGCLVRTPDGSEYDIGAGETVPGVEEMVGGNLISCGIIVRVESEEQVGDWMLIAKETMAGYKVVRRLNFTINVEEQVNASPRDWAVVSEGNDFYMRLEQPTPAHETCHIEGPGVDHVQPDDRFVESCGFVIRNVVANDSGVWEIVYGDKIVYRATLELSVKENLATNPIHELVLTLTRDKPVNETLWAKDAIYCILTDPSGDTIYDGFGRCQLVLDRVTIEHEGKWTMKVGVPGRVLLDEFPITVTVQEAESKPKVDVWVGTQPTLVAMFCRVSTSYNITACKFRDPAGNILIASEGLGEDRYSFYGNGTRYESDTDLNKHECGLVIVSPAVTDLGLWRCAIETAYENYYGFLTVLWPKAMTDPAVAASVQTEPVLIAEKPAVSLLEGDPVTMRCRVDAAIQYCYFRARNGSVFSIEPYTSTANYVYVGAGFDAGECSIRIHSLSSNEGGAWSCHVGFVNSTKPEQRASINVEVKKHIVVQQYETLPSTVVVEGQVYDKRTLDYCRFVRIDGFGFTSSNLPKGYSTFNNLATGLCGLRIQNPSILENHPWAVVAKIAGHDEEITGVTSHTMEMPPNTSEPGEAGGDVHIIFIRRRSSLVFFLSLMFIFLILAGVLLISRTSREWTYERTARVRDSFRGSFGRTVKNDGVVTGAANELPKKEALPAYTASV